MKIAIFGGSFNPVHHGHIKVAELAIQKLKLDKLIFVPCFKSVDKQTQIYIDGKDRVEMLKLVLPDKCCISDFELSKQQAIQSYETVVHFKAAYPHDELFFIIGDDLLPDIDKWYGIEEINTLTQIVVFNRQGYRNKTLLISLNILWMDNQIFNYSSSLFREGAINVVPTIVLKYMSSLQQLKYNFSLNAHHITINTQEKAKKK